MAVTAGSNDFENFLDQRLGATTGVFSDPISAETAAGISRDPSSWTVFLGTTPNSARGAQAKDVEPHSMFSAFDKTASLDDASAQIYSWNSKQVKAWEKLLLANGLIKAGDYNFSDLVQMWQGAVVEAGKMYSLAGKKVTPQDFVKMNGAFSGGSTSQARTVTRTDSTTHDFSELDARAEANSVFQALLGRDASDKSSAALEAALDAYAQSHPQVNRSTNRYNAHGDLVDTQNRTSGGISDAGVRQVAEDQAMSNSDYAEHQASSTMMNWLIQGLAAPVQI